MPEIRQAIEQARALTGQEDTNEFAVEAPRLLARLVAILDLYVGHEPTIAEEAAYVRSMIRAQVLAEAEAKAREVVAKLWGGGITQQQLDRTDGARAVELEIGLLAVGKDTGDAHQAPAGESTQAAPDFFQPGHGYTRRDGTTFQCITVTTTPWNGCPLAIGWHTDIADITSIAWRGVDEWRHEYDGAPAGAGKDRDAAPDYKAAVGRALELLETAPEAFHPAPSQNITAAAHVLRQTHEAGGGQ